MPEIPETTVTYEELADLEREFEDVETEMIRLQVQRSAPLYEKRAALAAKIPNFWPLVFEGSPPEVDEYIQQTDAALLLAALKDVKVEHFELESGDPRSVSIRFEFAENDHFEDKVLEKKFWYRHDKSLVWSGLVSEPVEIKWKEGKDLTDGLLALSKKVWDEEQAGVKAGKPVSGWTETRKQMQNKLEETGLGGLSFFTWFGYIGSRVTAAESADAEKKIRERRALRAEGKEVPEIEEAEDDEEEEIQEEIELCPGGSDLAFTIADDLWPGAIKYFTEAMEIENMSDLDFESDEEMGEDDEGDDGEAPPLKKTKA